MAKKKPGLWSKATAYKVSEFAAKLIEDNTDSDKAKSAAKILKNVKKLESRSERVQEKALATILKSASDMVQTEDEAEES